MTLTFLKIIANALTGNILGVILSFCLPNGDPMLRPKEA